MATILPHLWFDKEAEEAARFYVSLFPDSGIDGVTVLRDTPSGDCPVVSFRVGGQPFLAISAGPLFKLNPSISFLLNFDPSRDPRARQDLDKAWAALSKGGSVLMPLDKYPFSERYGWVQDRFGVSWQLILTDPAGEPRPFLVPFLMFTKENAGRAEEAIRFYTSVFKRSKVGDLRRYPAGMAPEKEGTLMFADFQLEGQWFAAIDSANTHAFTFNEAVSLLVQCDSQKEIDTLWSKLSAVPAAEQCGWLKDRFGVSWQVTAKEMAAMMGGTPAQVARVTQAFLPMKKIDLATLRKAYAGDGAAKPRPKPAATRKPPARTKHAGAKRKAAARKAPGRKPAARRAKPARRTRGAKPRRAASRRGKASRRKAARPAASGRSRAARRGAPRRR
jgi:predicted 3-demethylubiquinone-9 3-methyltransferase (glyoxalase superfamily)